MQELTMRQMSETDGSIGFRGFFDGFLCGATIAGLVILTLGSGPVGPLSALVARRLFMAAAVGACGNAFFV